jgi:arylsulfatase A-like enzyme
MRISLTPGMLCVIALSLLFALSPSGRAGQTRPANPPNFVVILMDDLGYSDIEPFGSTLNRTPHLNRMAAEGMKLTDFYAAAVCTPTRAQLLTGCQAKRVSLPRVLTPGAKMGLNPEEKTIAALLKPRGYATMAVGKWHLGDHPNFLPTKHGFDHFVGLPYSNNMEHNNEQAKIPLPLLRDEIVAEAPVDQEKLTRLYTEEAVQFIRANRDKPFFLYLAHTAVHMPLHPGNPFKGKSRNGSYVDWVEESDWSVGQVLETLRELRLDSNTLVLFTSDNGPLLSLGRATPFRGGKATCWEGGIRVPTIAWWPGRIPAGKTCAAPFSGMDLLPTFMGLAGGKPPENRIIDGKDIWPLLSGQTKESPHESLPFFYGGELQGLRAGKWKLLIRPQNVDAKRESPSAQAIPALFDLEADPGETNNLAGSHPDIVAELQQRIAAVDKDLGVTQKSGPGVRSCGRVPKAGPPPKK